MALGTTFKDLTNSISVALIDTTRTASQISNEDIAFHRSSNPSIVSRFEQQNSRLLGLARRLTSSAVSGIEITEPEIFNADSIEDNWREIVDVVDNLLEKADACLDEFTGVIRKLSPTQEEHMKRIGPASGKQKPAKAYRTQNIAKPQLSFVTVPNNYETGPFKPLLRTKPNAIVTLDDSLKLVAAEDGVMQYDLQLYLSSKNIAPRVSLTRIPGILTHTKPRSNVLSTLSRPMLRGIQYRSYRSNLQKLS